MSRCRKVTDSQHCRRKPSLMRWIRQVGETLCQHLWGGTEPLEADIKISLKYGSAIGEDCWSSFRSSHQVSTEVMSLPIISTLYWGFLLDEEAVFTTVSCSTGVRVSEILVCLPPPQCDEELNTWMPGGGRDIAPHPSPTETKGRPSKCWFLTTGHLFKEWHSSNYRQSAIATKMELPVRETPT